MEDQQNDSSPKDKEELLARIERGWSALLRAIEGLRPEQMAVADAGGWSAKDNLAHLAAWQRYLLLHYLQGVPADQAMGVPAGTMDGLDTDEENAILVERDRSLALAEVLEGLHRSHAQLVAFLQQAPYADLLKPRDPDDPEAPLLLALVAGDTYEHYDEHRAAIEAMAAG